MQMSYKPLGTKYRLKEGLLKLNDKLLFGLANPRLKNSFFFLRHIFPAWEKIERKRKRKREREREGGDSMGPKLPAENISKLSPKEKTFKSRKWIWIRTCGQRSHASQVQCGKFFVWFHRLKAKFESKFSCSSWWWDLKQECGFDP